MLARQEGPPAGLREGGQGAGVSGQAGRGTAQLCLLWVPEEEREPHPGEVPRGALGPGRTPTAGPVGLGSAPGGASADPGHPAHAGLQLCGRE